MLVKDGSQFKNRSSSRNKCAPDFLIQAELYLELHAVDMTALSET